MSYIYNLPNYAVSSINSYLTVPDRARLSRTSVGHLRFATIGGETTTNERLAKYIEENCDVIAASKKDLLSLLFNTTIVVGLGENHSYDEHRYFNASIIAYLAHRNMQIFIEGCEHGVKQKSKHPGFQLKYLHDKHAIGADSWDRITPKFYNLYNWTKNLLPITQQLYTLKRNFTFEGFLSVAAPYMASQDIAQFKKLTSQIKGSPENISVLHKRLFYILSCHLYEKFVEECKQIKAENKQNFFDRNDHLLKVITSEVAAKNSGLYVAGYGHYSDAIFINEMRKLHRKNQTFSYLFVAPKTHVSINQTRGSFQHHFHYSIDHILPKIEPAKPNLVVQPSVSNAIDTKKLLSVANKVMEDMDKDFFPNRSDIDYLENCLFQMRADDINMNYNHFSYWLHLCMALLRVNAAQT